MNPHKRRIDISVIIIASLGPLLWVFDSVSSAIVFKESIIRQLFMPDGNALGLRLWVLFFTSLVAAFWARYAGLRSQAAGCVAALQALLERLPAAVVMTDAAGRITHGNYAARSLAGPSSPPLAGLEIAKLCADAESERISGIIEEAVKNGRSSLTAVALAQGPAGKTFDVSAFSAADIAGSGKTGVLVMFAGREAKRQEAPVAQAAPGVQPAPASGQKESIENALQEARIRLEQEFKDRLEKERREMEERLRHEEEQWRKEQLRIEEQKRGVADDARAQEASRAAAEAARAEERAKAETALAQLRASLEKEFEERLEEQKQFIEAGVREQEQEKTRQQMNEAENQFNERMKNWLQETRQAIEDEVRREEQEKAARALRALEEKYRKAL